MFLILLGTALAAADDNVCNSDGKQTTLNGKVHTCGTCPSGEQEPTRMWFIGDLTSDQAVDACKCAVDKSTCTTESSQIVAETKNQKAPEAKTAAPRTAE